MKAIIVDDEPLILKRFERLLEEIEEIEVIGKYTNPHKALKAIIRNQPDVVFLDIEMPELNGIEIAKKIKNEFLNIYIVFVTAYRDYAVTAFDLNAIDYLIRPVQKHRLQETMKRIKYFKTREKPVRTPLLCCFGSLKFKWSNDIENIQVKWRTKKTQELFAFLVHNRQKVLRKDALVDLLWPHVEWDQGMSLLYTAIYQIRKTLRTIGFNIEIINSENTYMLNLNNVILDVHTWEENLEKLPEISNEYLHEHKKVLKMYKGDYLTEHNYPWAEVEKKRLRSIWLYHVEKVAEYLISNKEYLEAIKLYHYVQEIYPVGEESYFNLMKLYNKINDQKSVVLHYETLKKILADEFATEPDDDIQSWFKEWKQKQV